MTYLVRALKIAARHREDTQVREPTWHLLERPFHPHPDPRGGSIRRPTGASHTLTNSKGFITANKCPQDSSNHVGSPGLVSKPKHSAHDESTVRRWSQLKLSQPVR